MPVVRRAVWCESVLAVSKFSRCCCPAGRLVGNGFFLQVVDANVTLQVLSFVEHCPACFVACVAHLGAAG